MGTRATELRAGPIRCRFADGELRYVKVGSHELVRRVFMGVRTKTWDTIVPRLTRVKIDKMADRFHIDLEAVCEREKAGYDSDGFYKWSGTIHGYPDGTIKFTVTGAPTRDFETGRLGLCVLFGTPEVCGTDYQIVSKDGRTRTGTFPAPVNFPLMFEPDFVELINFRDDTHRVKVAADGDCVFSMEDQRNFGDTSFKAYAPLDYAYPNLKAGDTKTQSITITPSGYIGSAGDAPPEVTYLTRGALTDARVPQLKLGSKGERNWFITVNQERDKTRAASAVSFAYFPVEHLYDDDVCWENVPCIQELAESARKIAPGKPIDIHHIALTLTHPRPTPEPRNQDAFGAAWAAACIKYASLAGVRSATFDFGPGPATDLVRAFAGFAGQPIRTVNVASGALIPPVEAFGIGEKTVVINKTDAPQRTTLDGRPLPLGPYEVKLV